MKDPPIRDHVRIQTGRRPFFSSGARPETASAVKFITEHRERWGVEPICRVLQFPPATYYTASTRPASAREVRDQELKPQIQRVWNENFRVHGGDKVSAQLRREGFPVARCTVERLMHRPCRPRTAARVRTGLLIQRLIQPGATSGDAGGHQGSCFELKETLLDCGRHPESGFQDRRNQPPCHPSRSILGRRSVITIGALTQSQ